MLKVLTRLRTFARPSAILFTRTYSLLKCGKQAKSCASLAQGNYRAATLCNFRKRLGVERFEKILNWLIRQCYEAGLITLEEAYPVVTAHRTNRFDFTGVKASATQLTPYQRVVVLAKALSAYLAGLDDHSIAEDEELASVLRRLILEVAQDMLSEKPCSHVLQD